MPCDGKESFEDEEVAHLLNQYYICIKVDREERPDLDHVYMAVTQMMTGRGGWPMTVIMTPEKFLSLPAPISQVLHARSIATLRKGVEGGKGKSE